MEHQYNRELEQLDAFIEAYINHIAK